MWIIGFIPDDPTLDSSVTLLVTFTSIYSHWGGAKRHEGSGGQTGPKAERLSKQKMAG